jgi:integrase
MAKTKLTTALIANIQTTTRTDFYDSFESGLILRVTPNGHKSFALRYRDASGAIRRITLGEYSNTFTLANARDRVREIKQGLSNGIDPKAEIIKRKSDAIEAERDRYTFAQLARDFQSRHLPTLSISTQGEYARMIQKHLLPEFGHKSVDSIRRRDVFAMHERIGIDDGHPRTANLAKAILSRMFNFAIEREYIESNPASHVKAHKAGKVRRDRYYTPDELRALWTAFDNEAEPVRSYSKILLLTGQRRGEIMKARWENIDLEKRTWTLPATDTKNKLTHIFPISPHVLEILNELFQLTGRSEYVFESQRVANQPYNGAQVVVYRIRQASGVIDFRLHDLRRTCATYMAELGVDRTVLGKVLNHKGIAQDHSVTAIYDRSRYFDEMGRGLQRWGFRLESIVTEQNDGARIIKMA